MALVSSLLPTLIGFNTKRGGVEEKGVPNGSNQRAMLSQ